MAGNYTVPICVHRVLRSRVAEEKEARMEKGNVTEDMLTINIRYVRHNFPVISMGFPATAALRGDLGIKPRKDLEGGRGGTMLLE
uniref:Uncharacterized protein n=1 Tax=Coccidioides posadasii RMSCC 3488 TaxID=454284 RepID=A0A0J6HZN4_COCPO|nr:hypothetical protein CPAG_00804 [Coccidioides posadasii RMSCC 3488]